MNPIHVQLWSEANLPTGAMAAIGECCGKSVGPTSRFRT